MKSALYPWWLILVILALVCMQVSGQPWSRWDDWIRLLRRARTSVNVRRHAERAARRQARWERRHRRSRYMLGRRLRRKLTQGMRQTHRVVSAPPRPVQSAVVPLSTGRAGQPPHHRPLVPLVARGLAAGPAARPTCSS